MESRLDRLEAENEALRAALDDSGRPAISRRTALGAVAGLAGLASVGSTSADIKQSDDGYDLGSDAAPLDVRAGELRADSITTDSLTGPDAGNSITQSLRDGYIVGVTNGYQLTVDPRDYTDAGSAIDDVNKKLVANMIGHNIGFVYFSPYDPDGNILTITQPIKFGSGKGEGTVLPRGWGFGGGGHSAIQCNVPQGEMTMEVRGDKKNGKTVALQGTWFGGFVLDGATSGSPNNIGGIELNFLGGFYMKDILLKDFDTTGNSDNDDVPNPKGAFVFNTRCFNSFVDHTTYQNYYETPNTDVWVFRDDYDAEKSNPGEIVLGHNNGTYSKTSTNGFNSGVRIDSTDADTITFNGRIEGVGGDGMIYLDNSEAYLNIGSGAELDRMEDQDGTGTPKVYAKNCYGLYISPNAYIKTNKTGAPLVKIDNITRGYIMPINNDIGDETSAKAIALNDDSSPSNPIVVPRETMLPGPVEYPDPSWQGIVYPDGWQLYREGTTELSAGGDTQANQFAGKPEERVRGPHEGAGWAVQNEKQNAGHEPEFYWKFANNNAQRELFVRDNSTSSTGSITIDWQIERS
ncbi:hypothetical protein [Haloarcula salinisoli]|uniref:Uncharacterized protein n=1 Tax=Haloarcula salinisoli TaxID=2487746 RepID=A0A8J8C6Z6_9EURY|nr:hypothetical protein [Halomicroarcula salinisoli]MBX0285696.1 hypothetical protein [Halomicroarcula salinisoli]MBX0302816.1 hypothetical protein [Halomicroarcula salinisoli]